MTAPSSHPNPELRSLRFAEGVPAPHLFYRFMRRVFQVGVGGYCGVRVFNRRHEPASGGVLYICNHQSFFDPILMSFALQRPMSFMARDSLFRAPLFRQAIAALNAFPVRRGAADTGALKEAMRRLRAGGQVVVFAEGTRTSDGRIGPFLPGVAMLAQRAAEWVAPTLIDGAFECWPREHLLPRPGNVVVQYAPPIPRDQARAMAPEQLLDRVRNTIAGMQTDVRKRLGRPTL